jgi:transposase
MAYRFGDRQQTALFPQSLEEYVAVDDPVRAYDAFVEALDLVSLGIALDANKVGNPEYDPQAMIKLLVYGYSYGLRSSRKLERAAHHNVSFIWLLGGLKPDHKTIARFRREHKAALKNILKQCARLCIKLELIEGNTLFVDGSKMRGNASIGHTWTPKRSGQCLKKLDARIESILAECERIDDREEEMISLVKLKEELKDRQTLKARVEAIQKALREQEASSLNTTDADCVKVKSRQGLHAGYNSQIVVDEKHGLIVHGDVVGASTDVNQFAGQIERAHETLGRKCQHACGDAGYADTEQLKKIDAQGVTVIVPSKQQAHDRLLGPFDKSRFHYDAPNDRYLCPQGHALTYANFCKNKQHRVYQIEDQAACSSCAHYGECTRAKAGRRIRRLADEETKLKLERQYKEAGNQSIYKLRKQKVELPFGHIKRNLGAGYFLLRGLAGVRAEMSLLASCFNLARMIGILGVPRLVSGLGG